MKNAYVSNAVIRRLPRYRRLLENLIKIDIENISSEKLAALSGLTASQIRQDFNNFGGFGLPGYGYNVRHLYEQIGQIIGLNNSFKMVIIGAGHLGQAIANFTQFFRMGFHIIAIFELNPKLIGLRINDIEVLDYDKLDEFLVRNDIDIGIITANKENALSIAGKLERGGVKGIWNFATVDLRDDLKIAVDNVHLSDSLQTLTYFMNQNRNKF
jgi:AT-rich DNA-binding protein